MHAFQKTVQKCQSKLPWQKALHLLYTIPGSILSILATQCKYTSITQHGAGLENHGGCLLHPRTRGWDHTLSRPSPSAIQRRSLSVQSTTCFLSSRQARRRAPLSRDQAWRNGILRCPTRRPARRTPWPHTRDRAICEQCTTRSPSTAAPNHQSFPLLPLPPLPPFLLPPSPFPTTATASYLVHTPYTSRRLPPAAAMFAGRGSGARVKPLRQQGLGKLGVHLQVRYVWCFRFVLGRA